jgi:hypothetical protein
MPFRGEDSGPDQARPDQSIEDSLPIRIVRAATSVSLALLVVSLLALIFAPKDPGTLTLYGLVIGLNLVIFLAFWPVMRWLRRLSQ